MTSSIHTYQDEWPDEEWSTGSWIEPLGSQGTVPIELAVILATLLVATLLGWGALNLVRQNSETAIIQPSRPLEESRERSDTQPINPVPLDEKAIIAPYDIYVVTQGIHGLSYGHMAIDMAAGKGEPIKAPINGIVTENYFDDIGNPTLVIENDQYAVTLLHGIYSVQVGERVKIGDQLGVESNIGNTRDMQGRSCHDRDCGYHTHLNVYDKEAETNINPLTLFVN
jgi:murein DD-endopeptidase MepM/ murein hydrolase activator NlpD